MEETYYEIKCEVCGRLLGAIRGGYIKARCTNHIGMRGKIHRQR